MAVRLMQVGAALSVLGIIFAFLSKDALRDQVIEDNPSFTSSEVDTAVNVGIAFGVVIGLIGAGVWLWMASANGQGKAWARTVATVLGGLNVLFTLIGIAGGQSTGLSIVASLIGIVLAVAILFYLYRPDSNQYYDRMSGRVGY
ncbi:MAG TPA: hypothetical protein VIL36_01665 [Acidimicrobiales bacterium]